MVQAIDIITGSTLAIIMFSIGLSLEIKDFKRIFKRPQEIGLGIALQLLALPLLAFAITEILPLPAEAKIGIIILAACPGGSTSNFISYLVRADAALSISMTSINSIITLASIPFFVNVALQRYMYGTASIQLPIGQTILTVLFIVILPVVVGVYIRKGWKKETLQHQQAIKIISIVLLALVYGIKFFAKEAYGGAGLNSEAIKILLPAVLLLHVLALGIGYALSKAARFNQKSSTTIGIEVGLQNTTLALLVAGTFLQNQNMSQAALIYAMFSFFTTTLFGWSMMRRDRKQKKKS